MNAAEHSTPDRLRSSAPFGVSSCIHGALLLWLVIAAARAPRETPKSLYDMEIRPFEKHIVWYNLREKLPDIKPVPAPAAKQVAPPRATRKFKQTLVAGKKDDSSAPQMIATDAPAVELPKPLPLPNVVAAAPPPPKVFLPPEEKPAETESMPTLPDAPRVEARVQTAADPLEHRMAAPEPLPFTPPEEKAKPAVAPAELPDAPKAAAVPQASTSPLATAQSKPAPLPFHPPPPVARPRPTAPLTLAEAPAVAPAKSSAPPSPLGNTMPRPQPRTFQGVPPSTAQTSAARTSTALTLPEAPVNPSSPPAGPSTAPRIPRAFSTPARKGAPAPASASIAEPPPAVNDPAATAKESFAIAGLDPAKSADIPQRPPSHEAGFSAAPEERTATGDASLSNDKAALVVPTLTAGGGATDSMPTVAPAPPAVPPSMRSRLLAELRSPLEPHLPSAVNAPGPRATPVSSSPDPRMSGRVVYTMAIQMPNVTSYSGSWMVWFAEHVPDPGSPTAEIRPPVPVHVVHPAYIRSAVDERIEGIVRLAGVIGKDGHMSEIEVLSGIDTRLDDSAEEALTKWLFEPARRNGAPIDVDAVFEVPFRLAPKTSK